MTRPSIKLYRLRGFFVFYLVLKSLVGAVVAAAELLRPKVPGPFFSRCKMDFDWKKQTFTPIQS